MKIKKQKTLIIILAALFVLLLAAYFVLIRPMLQEADDGVKLDLMEGEVKISDKLTNFYIFESIPRSNMQSIKVENSYGGYEIYRDSSDTFQLRGNYNLTFNPELFASLVVSAGTPVAYERIARDLSDEEFAQYGLDTPQASWTVTTIDGRRVTVYVGDAHLSDAGYYVRLDGRNAVYMVGSSIAETVLQPVTKLIDPVLVLGLTQNNYYLADNFIMYRGEEPFVAVDRTSADDSETIQLALVYPIPEGKDTLYELNTDTYLNAVYAMVDLAGESVVALVKGDGTLMEYGLLNPAYRVHFTFNGVNYSLYVSKQQKDGSFYAVSNITGYQIICKIPKEKLEWLNSDKFNWIQSKPFYLAITEVDKIKLQSEKHDINVEFVLEHDSNEDDSTILNVTETVTGTFIPNSSVSNFRQFYLSLLNIANQQYTSLSDEDKAALVADKSKLILTMTIDKANGKTVEYKFYQHYEASTGHISGGKVFVVVDGEGEFYTTNDLVQKVINDIPRVLNGEDIDGYGKN